MCPLSDFCATRGELPQSTRERRQKKRKLRYALARRKGEVFLVQRARDESLMPGMWELPAVPPSKRTRRTLLQLRHSITITDYDVQVVESLPADDVSGRWIPKARLDSVALTGLARKILNRAGLI
jgi:A/G-specific adenine glycosylase